jgi:hypothetical protein
MPKAARARVASPPAGTALARAIRLCLPDRVQLGRDSNLYVTLLVTYVKSCHYHSDVSRQERPLSGWVYV